MDKGIPTPDEMWVQAIQLRVEDMLKTHPEIDEESLALLVETLGAGLRSSNKLLQAFQSGCSFIESDFDDPDEEFNTKLSGNTIRTTKTSHVLPNGVRYSISKPIFNSKKGKTNVKP
jgi:hypothetical protein